MPRNYFKKNFEELKKSIFVIADDLTGAADTGLQFAKKGLETLVLISYTHIQNLIQNFSKEIFDSIPVLVINTGSRGFLAKKAYKAVQDVFQLIKKRELIYKKVDSTMRGNIGSELDAVMDITGKELTVFCAAYSKLKRYTIGGIHQLDHIPISSTDFLNDPVNPVKVSNVKDIISLESIRKVAVIDQTYVAKGNKVLFGKIIDSMANGSKIIAFDAACERDLHEIGLAALQVKPLPVFSGSAGLAEALVNILWGYPLDSRKHCI